MRVAFLDPLEDRLKDFPAQYLSGHDVLVTTESGVPPAGCEDAEAVVSWYYPIDAAFLNSLSELRFLQRIGITRSKGDATAALTKGVADCSAHHNLNRIVFHYELSEAVA